MATPPLVFGARLLPSEASQFPFLRDRTRSLEKYVLIIRGHADVWKSKAEWATAREEFLLEEFG